ncbi:MAG: ROK family protein [Terriglobales bacterium]
MEIAQSRKSRVVAGVDIGGTKIAIGLIDYAGKVIVRGETPTHVDQGPEAASARMIEILRTYTQQTGSPISGIGIGCTGPVDPTTGKLGDVCTLPDWRGWNPVQELSVALGVTVAMENDADAAALGEARWGAGRGRATLISITVGTGIGAGIILNGEVYRGADGSHPELGHHIVEPSGPLCTCGASGCWESLASGPALEQWYAKHNLDEQRTGKEICSMARAGHVGAQNAVDRMAKYLGLGLSNVVSMFVPDVIALSGGIMQNSDLFLDRIRSLVLSNSRLVPAEKCEIAVSSLGADAGLIGAAQVWHSRFER